MPLPMSGLLVPSCAPHIPPGLRYIIFSDDGFQAPQMASGALRTPGTYPGAPWGPREAQASVISI